MRRLRWLGLLPLLPVLYLAAALIGALVPGSHVPLTGVARQPVGFAAGPIHYDLLLPLTPDLRNRLAFAAAAGVLINHPEAEWLVVGWGGEAFYTTVGTYADLSAQAVWRAVTGDASVLRLDVAGRVTTHPGLDWHLLADGQLAALITRIEDEFLRDSNGRPIPLAHPGQTGTDAFFSAQSRFHLFRTCNVWLGQVLRAAGVPFGAWTPTTRSVRLSLWWNAIPASP